MAALEDVGLGAAEAAARVVAAGAQLGELRLGRAAVVAGEDHQRLPGQALRSSSAASTSPTAASTCMTKSA